MIRVVVADDQTLVRDGICNLLDLLPNVQVVAQASGGHEALAAVKREEPDVVLLDIRMPDLSGIDVVEALHRRGVAAPCILLTTFDDPDLVLRGMRAGARGYLLKDVSLEQLGDAIERVHAGGSAIQPGISERVLQGLATQKASFDSLPRPDLLSTRETEILRLIAGGYSNREIADGLGLSEGTVKNYVSNVLSKLGVRDRTRAVLKAAELGWLTSR